MSSARPLLPAVILLAALAAVLSGCSSVSGALGGYTSRTPGEDGRFTIGTGSKRLMYGYPIPYSTSHFVVAVDGRYASNNPRFPNNVEYLTGTLLAKGTEASAHTEISFQFQGLDITQRLIPVDRGFQDVGVGSWGQYYRIEYEITNPTDATKTVGLSLLIDTMIDDNDASQMDADGVRVAQQASFRNPTIPAEVLVYRVPGNNAELVASLVTAKGKAVKPDYLYVGRWPYLHSVVWDINLVEGGYTDSGLLLKWDVIEVPSRSKRYLATHYGLPNGGQLSLLTAAEGFRKDTANVYFELGKADLNADARQRIDAALSGRTVSGVFVEVYTDAVGNEAANLQLSKKRADNVTQYLKSKNVQPTVIIPKSYGESYADQSEEARKGGKQQDRRATIVVFSR
jgi:outer membrane protein OmpA-like peptidoglycan-associated protein